MKDTKDQNGKSSGKNPLVAGISGGEVVSSRAKNFSLVSEGSGEKKAAGASAEGKTKGGAVTISDELIERLAQAVAKAVEAELVDLLFVHARLTAADTLHTSLKAATVFKYAIQEAMLAKEVYNNLKPAEPGE